MRDHDKIRSLHAQGKNDVQIAKEIGVTPCTVLNHRRRLGLAANWYPRIDHARLRHLWSDGKTDDQIAAEMEIKVQAVRGARDTKKLPVNRAHVRTREYRDYQFSRAMGDPMETALTPEQCEEVRRFLHELIRCDNQKRPGQTADVNRFLREYTGR